MPKWSISSAEGSVHDAVFRVNARPVDLASGNVRLGIGLMLLAYFTFSMVDSSVKWLVTLGIPSMQLAFMRYAGQFSISCAAILCQSEKIVRPSRTEIWLIFVRAGLLITATVFNFYALRFLSLTVSSSILFASPLIVAALSGPLLGEPVGLWRRMAIVLGFAGVLTIIRPFGESFHWTSLLLVYNAFAFALFSLITRRLSGSIAGETMQFILGGLGTVTLLPFAVYYWENPDNLRDWLLLFGIGCWAWLGHGLFIRAHVFAPAGTLMPYTYSLILYMTALGVFVFGDLPDLFTILGALIIVASGLLIWWRETGKPGVNAQAPTRSQK